MTKRILILALLCLILLPLLVSCKGNDAPSEPSEEELALTNKAFIHDRTMSVDKKLFVISLKEENTFVYAEGYSSYIGTGTWSLKDGVLTLKEDKSTSKGLTFVFTVTDTALIYREDGSDPFPSGKVKDGDTFTVLQDLD